MSKLSEVVEGIKNLLTRFSGTGGITTHIPSTHIHTFSELKAFQGSRDETFPKVSYALDGGTSKPAVARATDKEATFDIIFFLKKTTLRSTAIDTQVTDCVEDFEKLLSDDPTLGGKATSAHILEFTTDSGAAAPIGVCYFRVLVKYRQQR